MSLTEKAVAAKIVDRFIRENKEKLEKEEVVTSVTLLPFCHNYELNVGVVCKNIYKIFEEKGYVAKFHDSFEGEFEFKIKRKC